MKIEEMNIEELVTELDKLGYEINLQELDKDTLLDIYLSAAGSDLNEEELNKAKKYNERTLRSKCRELGDSIDLDLLPKNVLVVMLKSVESSVDLKPQETKELGERIEESKRRVNEHKEPTELEEKKLHKTDQGVLVKSSKVSAIVKVDCSKKETMNKYRDFLVGYDPVTKSGFVRESDVIE